MDLEKLNKIIEDLQSISPLKARRLRKLTDMYQKEQDSEKKNELHIRIYNYVYHVFGSCLTRECRSDLYNTNTVINEESYSIEQRRKTGYRINMDGVERRMLQAGEVVTKSFIGRDYEKGFYMLEAPESEEDKEEFARQSSFYFEHVAVLNQISDYMDHKLDLVTFQYEIKDDKIPRGFTESIIDFLGLRRIDDQKRKSAQKTKKGN